MKFLRRPPEGQPKQLPRAAEAIQLEATENTVPFVVERDLLPEARQRFIQVLEVNRKIGEWQEVAKIAYQINFLFPHQPLKLSETDWLNLKETFDQQRTKKDWASFVVLANYLKHLFPHKVGELGLILDLNEDLFVWLHERKLIFDWKILFPQKTIPDLIESWSLTRQDLDLDLVRKNIDSFASNAMAAKLAFPEHWSEIKQRLDPKTWIDLKTLLNSYQNRMARGFKKGSDSLQAKYNLAMNACDIAFSLLVLANDSEITPDGFIRINRPAQLIQKANPLPPRSLAA